MDDLTPSLADSDDDVDSLHSWESIDTESESDSMDTLSRLPPTIRGNGGLLDRAAIPELGRAYTPPRPLSAEEDGLRKTAHQQLCDWAGRPAESRTLAFQSECPLLVDHDIPRGIRAHRSLDLDTINACLPLVDAFQRLLVTFRPGNPFVSKGQECIPNSSKVRGFGWGRGLSVASGRWPLPARVPGVRVWAGPAPGGARGSSGRLHFWVSGCRHRRCVSPPPSFLAGRPPPGSFFGA